MTNRKSSDASYLRLDISSGNLGDVRASASLPKEPREIYAAVKAAGFVGVQGGDLALCKEFGLRSTGSSRVSRPEEADEVARAEKALGHDLATLHVGRGMESDDEIDALIQAIIAAAEKHEFPLYVETHRATITQDIYRTVQFTLRNPEVRFNGDFSHWYTGLEMVYGDFPGKLNFLQPVFDRTRFIHARIGNPGSMQVDIGSTLAEARSRSYVQHFQEMWTRSFVGFLKSARRGEFICFTPELLHSNNYYARLIRGSGGQLVEESDRWEQALLYCELAQECFTEAQRRLR